MLGYKSRNEMFADKSVLPKFKTEKVRESWSKVQPLETPAKTKSEKAIMDTESIKH